MTSLTRPSRGFGALSCVYFAGKKNCIRIAPVASDTGASDRGSLQRPAASRAKSTASFVSRTSAPRSLLGNLKVGDFGARPMNCEYCELKPVCRISQRQLAEDGS